MQTFIQMARIFCGRTTATFFQKIVPHLDEIHAGYSRSILYPRYQTHNGYSVIHLTTSLINNVILRHSNSFILSVTKFTSCGKVISTSDGTKRSRSPISRASPSKHAQFLLASQLIHLSGFNYPVSTRFCYLKHFKSHVSNIK